MDIETIGLEGEQRSDFALRGMFVELFDVVSPCLDDQGCWVSLGHEIQARDALAQRFPDIAEMRMLAVLAIVSSVRASGRTPS